MVLGFFGLANVVAVQTVSSSSFHMKRCLLTQKRQNVIARAKSLKPWSGAISIIVLRVVRVWNQTGQKHAGEADIAKAVLPLHNHVMWIIIVITYLGIVLRLSRRANPWASRRLFSAAAFTLGVIAFDFKVTFTKADAPELLDGLHYFAFGMIATGSLVTRARGVFLSIMAMTVWIRLPSIRRVFNRNRKDIGTPWIAQVVGFLLS